MMNKKKIKFRIWDGERYHYPEASEKKYNHFLQLGRKGFFILYNQEGNQIVSSLKDGIIQEYIGIKDKNGIYIYEGDLLVDKYPVVDEDLSQGYHKSYLPVVWSKEKLQWCVDVSFKKNGSCLVSLINYFGEFLEVVGNIYENPEILK